VPRRGGDWARGRFRLSGGGRSMVGRGLRDRTSGGLRDRTGIANSH